MYTLETLIPDCVGRYIQSPNGAVQLDSLIDGRTYAKCWQALIFWVVSQYEAGNSTNLAPIGIIVRSPNPLNDPNSDTTLPKLSTFRFLKVFLDRYRLESKSGDFQNHQDDVSTIRMNLATLSKLAGVEPQTFRIAMTHLFQRLGEVLSDKEQVFIDFNIGSLIGDKGVVDFLFHENAMEQLDSKQNQQLNLMRPLPSHLRPRASPEVQALRRKYPLKSSPIARIPQQKNLRPTNGTLPPLPEHLGGKNISKQSLSHMINSSLEPGEKKPTIDILPNSTSSRFRRKLRGNAPLKAVRRRIDQKRAGPGLTLGNSEVSEAIANGSVHVPHPPSDRRMIAGTSPSRQSRQSDHKHVESLPPVRPISSGSNGHFASTGRTELMEGGDIKRRFRMGKNMPPVLDAFARTRAATYSGERYYQSVSSKVGSFYTPEAAQYTIDNVTGNLIHTGFQPFQPNRIEKSPQEKEHEKRMKRLIDEIEHPLVKRARVKSLMRYQFYVENLIQDECVAPIKEEWIRNSLTLLSTNISGYVDDARVEELVRDMLVEMRDDYRTSMKRTILDYVLRNNREQKRLTIPTPPEPAAPDWGLCETPDPPPRDWREPIQQAYLSLSQNLFCNNPAMVALLQIWQKYEHYLLVDLPSEEQIKQNPITIQEFATMQDQHLKHVQKIFIKDWGDEVEDVFERYAKANGLTDENSERFFESVATLMSNQLRTIVQNSADAYHEFFLGYKNSPAIQFTNPNKKNLLSITNPVWIRREEKKEEEPFRGFGRGRKPVEQPDDDFIHLENNPRPVFVQTLSVMKMKDMSVKITYEIPLTEMDSTVNTIFENIVAGLRDISRVENKIFSMIDEVKYLPINVDNDAGESIWSLKREVAGAFNRSIREAFLLAELYEDYQYILDEDTVVGAYLKQPHTLAEYKTQIDKYRKVASELSTKTHNEIRCPMIILDCTAVNELLIETANKLAKQILNFVAGRNIERNVALCERFKIINASLLKKPMNTKDLVDLVAYLNSFKSQERQELVDECKAVKQQLQFLFESEYLVGKEVLQQINSTWEWLRSIPGIVKDSEDLVQSERTKMEKEMEERRAGHLRLIENYALQVEQFGYYGEIKKIAEWRAKIHSLKENIAKAEEEIETLHHQQRLLDLPETDFYALQETKLKLQPYEELWTLVSNFNKSWTAWMRGPVFKLDGDEVEAEVDRMWKLSGRLLNLLKEEAPDTPPPNPVSVAAQIKKELSVFRPHVPLLHILCNKGMRDRHWAKISDVVGFDLRPDRVTNLARVLDMGIDKYIDELQEISEAASRQFNIEKACKTMKEEWKDVHLQVKKHRDTGTYILLGDSVEEIQTLLDDHIVKTQTMKGSPYATPFINDIKSWEHWLLQTQETVEVWLKVQASWIYLEPVFGAEDIIKQMPQEGTMFKVVDSNWHKLMAEVVTDTKMLNVTNIPHILSMLQNARQLLDTINSRLNQYLETKRLFFPRFYFLSNDELLEILSETKDPLRVQPHMKKCFEGIHKLEFKDNLDIVAMHSKEGEIVHMKRVINPNDANGAVERWLKEFETVMRETVLDQAGKAIKVYDPVVRTDWVLDWPGQIVLAGSQIFWTQGVAKAIKDGVVGLREFLDKSNDELNAIVIKVRGRLTKLARCTMGALVVIDVHARDVVELLIESKVDDVRNFDWISQLRYYWEDTCINVRMITSTIEYGCEYIGNSSRLVITQLTDRCYRTLMGAIQLRLGGAPEGPAGTGKTETVKDLAKAVGIQCVVFNCSDGLDFKAMGKFFKGLAASGAWACFDEFNRIDLEVLSVVAQQIQTIQRAKELKKEVFNFEGTDIALQPRCAVFITMNPGYAGRSELPDNLKAQFRTVAMMVPDYGLIAQILLYSYGFVEAQNLSRKIVSTYSLCSQQLSSQDHYDYGMRAVRSVLTAAENLKKAQPDEKESVLMLRAITDVNLPKFLSQDIPLFEGIIADLFPNVNLPKPDYEDLIDAIKAECKEMNLQAVPGFIQKILQLYETINVRHGLMIVGLPFASKTCCYRVLRNAINSLAKQGKMNENHVQLCVLNPKSVTSGELYGESDPVSEEWTDGILAQNFRKFATDTSPDRKWMMFDGPVDAIWIENMNTVLDDNRKLCLMSGQIIHMANNMNMIFEVRDLEVASPATVSRCGMVYMEPHVLGWRPHLQSWLKGMPPAIDEKLADRIETLFDWLVDPCLRVLKQCDKYTPVNEINLVVSLMRIYGFLLNQDFQNPNMMEELGQMKVVPWLESLFLFSLVWSIGAAVDEAGRRIFDKFLREVCREVNHYKLSSQFPKKGLVYDVVWDAEMGRWLNWTATINTAVSIPSDAEFTEIVIPTVDTARYQFLLNIGLKSRYPVLFVGPTGTGKSLAVTSALRELPRDQYDTLEIIFSAQSTAKQTQNLIDDKLDRRRRGVYGPSGQRKMVILVDDMNMPKKEKYGAQPAIELLRQWMDHGGWYDIQDGFKGIIDIQFTAAMGPAGGGRSEITDRFLRHFSIVNVAPFEDATMCGIFNTIVKWHFDDKKFNLKVSALADKLVQATRDVYYFVCNNLLPSPAKSHYTYNLRDFAGVIQGLLLSQPEHYEEAEPFIRLWIHEVHRIFCDRLINDDDAKLFLDCVKDTTKKRFNHDFNRLLGHLDIDQDGKVDTVAELRCLFFGDYMTRKHPRPYTEIRNPKKLTHVWKNYLEDYNDLSQKPMNLVMFRFAIEHASRIVRILKQPRGNALLVGVGGSGKQSLTRLAASVMEFDVIQVELTKSYGQEEWHEDLRVILKKAGGEGKPTVFLFTDSQLRQESFLEDINAILNSGEVPNLFQGEDYAEVLELVRNDAKKHFKNKGEGSPSDYFSFFTERVKRNLHIVFTMSPIGGAFRERLRMFPSLVNCCTIDWFQKWPVDALESVAAEFLNEVEMEEETRDACVEVCMYMHNSVDELATEFFEKLHRHYYVTPTSYLELITTFKTLLANKRQEVLKARGRYQTGLDKLMSTEKAVKLMQIELEDYRPVLLRTSEETNDMIQIVEKETVEANKIREGVAAEEKIATEAANTAKFIEQECAADLAEAMPILEAAIAALDTLTQQEIAEVKGMRNPPKAVKLVMECLCVMKDIKPARVPEPGTGKMIEDYWEPSKRKILSDPKLLRSLKAYDKDNVPSRIIRKIRQYIQMPEFDINKIKNTSRAAHSLCSWIYAIEAYDKVIKEVKPKKEALAKSKAEYDVVKRGLDMARAELNKVENKINALKANLEAMEGKKIDLENKMQLCATKLDRAHKLLNGLGGEKSRWTELAEELGGKYDLLTGHMLLSSAVIAYLGAFTTSFRDKAITDWTEQVIDHKIAINSEKKFLLADHLGVPTEIRGWIIDGLPNDTFSIDNGIIISHSRRWPLLIDPQSQANKWIKNMESEHKLSVVKSTDDFFKILEASIRFGTPCLMENVGEELDPTLEPLLLKQVFRKGSVRVIKFGDSDVEYSDAFRMYFTTKLRNPHYLPELAVKVALLNFMITPEGLEDQLLAIVVAKEKPDLENERSRLVVASANNQRRLKEIENQILQELSQSKGNILDDENAIEVLSASKAISDEIQEKQKIAAKTGAEIEATRDGYQPVAFHASVLFFCISDLCNVDPMYQYSLGWYINLFVKAIADSDFNHILATRIKSLNDFFTFSLYENVCRSLFEKHKLLFSFLLCCRLLGASSKLDAAEYRFLLTGGLSVNDSLNAANPTDWVLPHSWTELNRLGRFSSFTGMIEEFKDASDGWQQLYDSHEPWLHEFPDRWEQDLTYFQKMLVLRCLRPDKILPAIRVFVNENLGHQFTEPPSTSLASCFRDSHPGAPIVFILSPGSDPISAINKFAADSGNPDNVRGKSLGQGQGPGAAALIQQGLKEGLWVVLQNCHLAPSWMPELELICEQINPAEAHPNFRLWLTSYPTPDFPISVLQNGVKLTTEPPKGLRSNLLASYYRDPISEEKFFVSCKKQKELKTMVYSLCFFHALVQERRNFGALGWNIPYGFNESDLRISVRQLHMFLNDTGPIPYKALLYLTGECNYGGRVTDDWDRRTINTIIAQMYHEDIFKPGHTIDTDGKYSVPPVGPFSSYIDHIKSLPLDATPNVFGLHENADITREQNDTQSLFNDMLITESGGSGGVVHDKNQILQELASDILRRLPERFDIELIQAKYKTSYMESMNTMLAQECQRYNLLIDRMRSSLQNMKDGLVGKIVMSDVLEKMGDQMYDGKQPDLWVEVSHPSLKPLGSYVNDLIRRLKFLQDWIDHDAPTIVWISGFSFTQAFLTAALQNFARKHQVAIDNVGFDFRVMGENEVKQSSPKPEDGQYITGLFLEGARWDYDTMQLADSMPKILFEPAPVIWLKPCRNEEMTEYPHYDCPVYKTSSRHGTLSTTGLSTNFVLPIRLPSDLPQSHWVCRGVALLTQLDS